MGDFADDDDNSLFLSSLLCHEDEACCFSGSEEGNAAADFNFDPCFVLGSEEEDDVEYIERLIRRENLGSRTDTIPTAAGCLTKSHSWLKCARSDAIRWILNTKAVFGFGFNTAYLSVVYFDLFLSKRSIDDEKLWVVRLLSVACLSLAAKMEECEVPLLQEFQLEDYRFENKVIKRMELLVLDTLEWKMGSITPFAYLHYFLNKICGQPRPKAMVSKAVEFVLAIMKEICLLDYKPSVVAAAAALAASDCRLTRKEVELKVNHISWWDSLQYEHIYSCYIIMQAIEMGKLKTPKQVFSPNSCSICSSSSTHSTSVDVLENSSFTSEAGTKRRLAFNDCDRNGALKKICQS